MMPTFDVALQYSSRAGSDLGRTLDRFEALCQLGFLIISSNSKACIINSQS